VPTAEIIVLANSKKLGGRCVAGISTRSGRWARPVSRLPNGKLEPAHCRVENRQPALLDVVRFDYAEQLGDPAQPENLLIEDSPWELVDHVAPGDAFSRLQEHLARGPELLGNRGRAVPEEVAEEGVDASLALIEPDRPPRFKTESAHEMGGQLRPRVEFSLGGQDYDLGITDFVVAPRLRALGRGEHSGDRLGFGAARHVLLTISLAEPLDEWHWKLVAAVLVLP